MKLLFVLLTAALGLSLAAGGASANRSIEVRGGERGVSAEGRLRFETVSGGNAILCDVTLRRTITRLIPKIPGTLFGKVTGIAIDRGETTSSPHCGFASPLTGVIDIQPLIGPERPCTHSENGRGILTYDC
jgi:hypothetical protein